MTDSTADGSRAAGADRPLPGRERPRRAAPARRAAHRRRVRPPVLPRHPRRRPVDRARAARRPDRLRVAAVRERRATAAADPAAGAGDSRPLRRLGILALQDLGDVTLQAHLGAASPPSTPRCTARRSRSSSCCSAAAPSSPPTGILPYGIAFDVEKLTWELEFFAKHFVEGYRGVGAGAGRASGARRGVAAIVEELAAEPRVLCHRDYHSRNLMLHDGSLYIIDFQDARMGPDTYDLASLLRDSYVDITDRELDELIALLPRAEGATTRDAADEFRRRFDLMALQRNLKALGTFGYQTITRRNPVYIQYMPRTLRYARTNLEKYPRFAASGSCSPRTSRNCVAANAHIDRAAVSQARSHRCVFEWPVFVSRTMCSAAANVSSGCRRISTTTSGCRAITCSRSRRTASSRSSCSRRGRTSTITTRPRSPTCSSGWRRPASSCTACTRRSARASPADAGAGRCRWRAPTRKRARGRCRSGAGAAHRAADLRSRCWWCTSACRARSRAIGGRQQHARRRGAASRNCSGWRSRSACRSRSK